MTLINQVVSEITELEQVNPVSIYDSGKEGCKVYNIRINNSTKKEFKATLSITDGKLLFNLRKILIYPITNGIDYMHQLEEVGLRKDGLGNQYLMLSPELYLAITLDTPIPEGEKLSILVDGEMFTSD